MDLSEAMKALMYGFNVARSDWSEGEYLTTNLDETGAIRDENGGQYFLEVANCNDIREEWYIYLTDEELINRGKIVTIVDGCKKKYCVKGHCPLFDKCCKDKDLMKIEKIINWPEFRIDEAYEIMRKAIKLEEI